MFRKKLIANGVQKFLMAKAGLDQVLPDVSEALLREFFRCDSEKIPLTFEKNILVEYRSHTVRCIIEFHDGGEGHVNLVLGMQSASDHSFIKYGCSVLHSVFRSDTVEWDARSDYCTVLAWQVLLELISGDSFKEVYDFFKIAETYDAIGKYL